jgi:hypothetical protein
VIKIPNIPTTRYKGDIKGGIRVVRKIMGGEKKVIKHA